ncbi:hypothetical protein Dsin_030215 [Dipteronia sinensis]|uniref:Uncharacterized protein n=1 Tax=Dipteronia sinensis TaxID=43782 RepID=A0AAE0DR13_9ROSI|nr:hypothetical protein Dsin_030215 [Dipteronia sinensis]
MQVERCFRGAGQKEKRLLAKGSLSRPGGGNRLEEEAPANSVPAAAVRRGGQVFFGMTGRKGHVGGESG